MIKQDAYDYRNCSSLFGYALAVHERSGGICQLCGAGKGVDPDFDFWRQLTVEHVIGESQGGEYSRILRALKLALPQASSDDLESHAEELEIENMVSACAFCNSATSREQHIRTMEDVINAADHNWDTIVQSLRKEVADILRHKRALIAWKLDSVRQHFETQVQPALRRARISNDAT